MGSRKRDGIDLSCVYASQWADDPNDDICDCRDSPSHNHLVSGGCWDFISCPQYKPCHPASTGTPMPDR